MKYKKKLRVDGNKVKIRYKKASSIPLNAKNLSDYARSLDHDIVRVIIKTKNLDKIKGELKDFLKDQDRIDLIVLMGRLKTLEGLEDVKGLKWLYANNHGLKSMKGIEDLTHLRSLSFFNNRIKKIEGLENLKKLRHLDFRNNRIEKIEGLQNLEHLEFFAVAGNPIAKWTKTYFGFDNLKGSVKDPQGVVRFCKTGDVPKRPFAHGGELAVGDGSGGKGLIKGIKAGLAIADGAMDIKKALDDGFQNRDIKTINKIQKKTQKKVKKIYKDSEKSKGSSRNVIQYVSSNTNTDASNRGGNIEFNGNGGGKSQSPFKPLKIEFSEKRFCPGCGEIVFLEAEQCNGCDMALNEFGTMSDADEISLQFAKTALTDLDPQVRKEAIDSLGSFEKKRMLGLLSYILFNDPDEEVRKEAADEMGDIHDPSSLDVLKKAMKDKSGVVRKEVISALKKIKKKND